MRKLAVFIGTTFGSGFSPIVPGTVGSLMAVVVLWLLPLPSTLIFSHIIVFLFFIGVWAAAVCEKQWGHDPGRVNWDEVVGMMISVLALPKTWPIYAAAFVLFRIFDIVKPFPVDRAERLPGGWGIMMDDVIAGIYANIALQIGLRMFHL
jgi:phosphatidylglycerophosphatase A